jgi:hypothetical protein
MLTPKITNVKSGAFSVSLAGKDMRASKAVFENLGFKAFTPGKSLES